MISRDKGSDIIVISNRGNVINLNFEKYVVLSYCPGDLLSEWDAGLKSFLALHKRPILEIIVNYKPIY